MVSVQQALEQKAHWPVTFELLVLSYSTARVRKGILNPKTFQLSAQHKRKLGWEEAQWDAAASNVLFSFPALFLHVVIAASKSLSSPAKVGKLPVRSIKLVHKYSTACCFPNRSDLLSIFGLHPTITILLSCFSWKFAWSWSIDSNPF